MLELPTNQPFTGDYSLCHDANVTVIRWTIGDVVRKLRSDRHWTQREFATKAGMAVTAANRLEQNSELSDQRTIRRAAQALNVPVSLLYRTAEFTTFFSELTEAQQGRVLEVMQEYTLLNAEKTQSAEQSHPTAATTTPAETQATGESAPLMRARRRR